MLSPSHPPNPYAQILTCHTSHTYTPSHIHPHTHTITHALPHTHTITHASHMHTFTPDTPSHMHILTHTVSPHLLEDQEDPVQQPPSGKQSVCLTTSDSQELSCCSRQLKTQIPLPPLTMLMSTPSGAPSQMTHPPWFPGVRT